MTEAETNLAATRELRAAVAALGDMERAPARGSGLTQSMAWGAGYSGIRELLPELVTRNFGAWKAWSAGQPKDSAFHDPEVAAGVTEWFKQSTLLQSNKGRINADPARFEKLDSALHGLDGVTKAAYAEGAAATGGNLVPTIVEADIIRQIKDSAKLFAKGRQFQMSSLTHDVPSESTSVTVGWASEAGTLTGGEGTIAKKSLVAKKVYGRVTMSIEVVEGLLREVLHEFELPAVTALRLA